MSVSYLVLLDGEVTKWRIHRDWLEGALLRDWPMSIMLTRQPSRRADGSDREILRIFKAFDGAVEGFINKDETCLYLDGQAEDVATFTAWFRSIAPADIELKFLNTSYTFNTTLAPGCSKGDVLEIMSLRGTSVLRSAPRRPSGPRGCRNVAWCEERDAHSFRGMSLRGFFPQGVSASDTRRTNRRASLR